MAKDHSKRVSTRFAILLLILTIAGLSAAAKQNKYLPKSNPAHFLDKATKMSVPHQPIPFIQAPLCPVAKVAPPQREFRTVRVADPEKPDLAQIGLLVSLQHRSPPAFLS